MSKFVCQLFMQSVRCRRVQWLIAGLLALTFFSCKQRPDMDRATTKESPAVTEGIDEEFIHTNFLPSIHGSYPPVGKRPGVLVNVRLGRFGGYDTKVVDAAVEELRFRAGVGGGTFQPAIFAIVVIDSGRVYAPRAVVSQRIHQEDQIKRAEAAKKLGASADEIQSLLFFTDDTEGMYRQRYGLSGELSMAVFGADGKVRTTCILPGELSQCLEALDQLLGRV